MQEELAHVMEDAKIMPSVLQVEVSVAVIHGCSMVDSIYRVFQ